MTSEDKEKVIELIDNKITEFIRKSPIRESEGVCNLGLEISEQIEALPVDECHRCKELEGHNFCFCTFYYDECANQKWETVKEHISKKGA